METLVPLEGFNSRFPYPITIQESSLHTSSRKSSSTPAHIHPTGLIGMLSSSSQQACRPGHCPSSSAVVRVGVACSGSKSKVRTHSSEILVTAQWASKNLLQHPHRNPTLGPRGGKKCVRSHRNEIKNEAHQGVLQ